MKILTLYEKATAIKKLAEGILDITTDDSLLEKKSS